MPPRKKRVGTTKNINPTNRKSPLKLDKNISASSSALPTHPIHRLPNELLQEIFFWHVWASFDTPLRLTLVCHLWNSIASSYPVLWANIYYGNRYTSSQLVNEEGLSYRMAGMIYCSDQESLNRAVAKTRNAKFELTVCWNGWYGFSGGKSPFVVDKLDPTPFSNRCRLLRFITFDAFETFKPWMKGIKLAALEEFLYLSNYPSTRFFHSFFPPLVEILHQGSPSLWNLTPAMELVTHYRDGPRYNLLPKLEKLFTWDVDGLFNNLTKGNSVTFGALEEMVICKQSFDLRSQLALHQRSAISIPSLPPVSLPTYSSMPSLKKLSLLSVSLNVLPKDLYGQITHLTLECPSSWCLNSNETGTVTATFPVLVYLSMNGWWDDLVHLDAPKLVTLLLGNQSYSYWREHSEQVTLLPEILYIDNKLPHSELCSFFQRNGKKVKDLYITYLKRNDTISKELVSALVGVKGKEPVCPLLETIDLICPKFDRAQRKELTRDRLQKVIEARKDVGNLRRVRYGCYPLPKGSSESLEFASREWWKVEWNELFQL